MSATSTLVQPASGNRLEDNGMQTFESDFSKLLVKDVRPPIHDKINDPMAYVNLMGEHFAKANIGGCSKPSEGICLAWALLEMGIGWVEFASKYHMVQGKPTLQAHEILARMRKAGHKVSWVNQGDDMKEASANFTVDGETTLVKYTWADAVKAKIQGFEKADSAWQRSGPAMMRAALLRKTSKMLCPEVLTGDVDPEEFAGIDDAAVAPKPTKSKAEQEARKAELQREATVAAAETGKPAPVEPAPLASQVAAVTAGKKEEPSFDAAQIAGTVAADKPTAEQAKANEHTAILLEIEATIGEAGLTKAKLEEGLRAKNPAFTTIDDLPLENAKALLANIRGKLAKK